MSDRHITPLSAVASPLWVPLSPGRLITTEPLRSTDGVATYARLPYRDALAVAAEMGAELPTREDLIGLHELARGLGTELRPVTLPTPAMCQAIGVFMRNEAAVERYRTSQMMSAEWCQIHDAAVEKQMLDGHAFPETAGPWANIGKPWIAGASKGRARLQGWWVEGDLARAYGLPASGGWIQSGIYPPGDIHERHDDGYCDYASCVVLVRAA